MNIPRPVSQALRAGLTALASLRTGIDAGVAAARTARSSEGRAESDALAALESRLRRHEELLHELRSVVVGITGASQLLREQGPTLPEATVARLEEMRDSELGRLTRLLREDEDDTRGPVRLDAVVEPLVTSFTARGVAVTWTGSDAWVGGPFDDVSEVLHILLSNAERHAPGSRVTIEVVEHTQVLCLRVSDDGPGVLPEQVDTIFQRGVRAPESPGRGLGLYIARRLCRSMGGELSLDTTSPGTTFVCELPRGAPPVPR